MENHYVEIQNRTEIKISEVVEVQGFDENTIFISLREENLIICGKNLHITALDLDSGILWARGIIDSVAYEKKKVKKTLKERFKR